MTNQNEKPPVWFWVVSTLALLWNLMGVLAYLGQAFATPEMLEALPEAERNMIEQRPAWATAVFATAVWGGTLGCLLLLLRKGLAYIVLVISLVGVLIQMSYNLFLAESTVDYGPGAISMTIMIPLVGVLLILLARKGKEVGWLK